MRAVLAPDGYDIRTAGDGPEVDRVLAEFRPRLILMDVQLPGADGFELTRRLKSDPATRDIIVVACTAYTMPGDEEKAHASRVQRLHNQAGRHAYASGNRQIASGSAPRRANPRSSPGITTIYWRNCAQTS